MSIVNLSRPNHPLSLPSPNHNPRSICLQYSTSSDTQENSCDPDSLTYQCVCSNGVTPNVTQYTLTLPYYVCTTWQSQCISNCGSNNTCSFNCQQEAQCGATDPVKANSSLLTSTTSAGGSATGAGVTTSGGQTLYSGLAGSSSTSAGGAASFGPGGAALKAGQTFGVLGLAALLFGGFAVLL
jgi:hypothetical protein